MKVRRVAVKWSVRGREGGRLGAALYCQPEYPEYLGTNQPTSSKASLSLCLSLGYYDCLLYVPGRVRETETKHTGVEIPCLCLLPVQFPQDRIIYISIPSHPIPSLPNVYLLLLLLLPTLHSGTFSRMPIPALHTL